MTNLTTGATLSGWNVSSPFYSGTGFNNTTGKYTVPATGRYSIKATVNYSTTAAITISQGAGVDPAFVIRSTNNGDMITGQLPVLNVNVALVLTLRTILGSATVTLDGEVDLMQGDVIELVYVPDGLTIPINVGGNSNQGVVWSIHQMTEAQGNNIP
ncbi:hypothetical protein SAMN02799630_03567 [Paenibacillus sp. UNCCL117]|nr:hypothetical protein SAMN04488602_10852 [Paenibacillus sp. cl123]SFW48445.1 hypothetical protein SAMN02799630_03567 [Paenibacillus sp. UNCCL117]